MTRNELLTTAKPILFNTDMVQAILENRKKSTRRIVKPQPKIAKDDFDIESGDVGFRISIGDEKHYFGRTLVRYYGTDSAGLLKYRPIDAKYKSGDILYVRETWKEYQKLIGKGDTCHFESRIRYRADTNADEPCEFYDEKWRPSIHMPKTAARIFLRVLSVRIERLQDITEDDAMKEGAAAIFKPSDRHKDWNNKWIKGFCSDCKYFDMHTGLVKGPCSGYYKERKPAFRTSSGCIMGFELRSDDEYEPARFRFSYLWDSTLQEDVRYKYGWDANPFVWVFDFERVIPDA